ncbi:MAG: hypothetical protein OXC94_11190 [Chloroflexi bacterium]|nr:hypothetical protein [Chloroflexota bacterium]
MSEHARRVARVLPAAALAAALLVLLALAAPALRGDTAPYAGACAFTRTPHAYEADAERHAYLEAIEAASANALFPGSLHFQLPAVETGARGARSPGPAALPPTLLKAIAWVESRMTMAISGVAFSSSGPALVSFDCGHGIMQVTTGMTVPLGIDSPTDRQASVATHYAYNIAGGAALLAAKWNEAPERRPVAGTDTGSDPTLVENWYYAVWGYNGFTGPGSNSSNHPSDPGFGSWPRPAYRCDGNQSRTDYPYQELVWGCLARPPTLGGAPLWDAIEATLPDLTQPQFFGPLSPAAFAFPFSAMDIPTPQPAHADPSPALGPGFTARFLGAPRLAADVRSVSVRLDGTDDEAHATVIITNPGSGILSWQAIAGADWIVVDPPAGVALGDGVDCSGRECSRTARLRLTANPTLLPDRHATGPIRLRAANANVPDITIQFEVDADFEIGAPGTSRLY